MSMLFSYAKLNVTDQSVFLLQIFPPFHSIFFFQAHELISTIRNKIKDLAKMHDKHINTPVFDEQAEEERAIEIATSEITSVSTADFYLSL